MKAKLKMLKTLREIMDMHEGGRIKKRRMPKEPPKMEELEEKPEEQNEESKEERKAEILKRLGKT